MGENLTDAEICALIIVAVLRRIEAHVLNVLIADKVRVQRLDQLVHRALLFVKHQMLDGSYRVYNIRLTDRDNAAANRVLCTARLAIVLSDFHGVREAHGQNRNRTIVHGQIVEQLVAGSDNIYRVVNVLLHCLKELLKCLERARIAGMNGHLLARDAALAVVERKFYHGAHVDVGNVRVFLELTGYVGLYTAARIPVPSLRERNALIHNHANAHIIGVNRRHGQTHRDGFYCLVQQSIRILCHAVSNCQIRLLELDVHRRLNHHVRQLIGRVIAVLIDAAAAGLYGDAVSCRVLRSDFVLKQRHFRNLNPQAVKQLLCLVIRDDAGFLVRLVVRIEVLIQTAEVVGRCILLHEARILVCQQRLHGFVQIARRKFRNVTVYLCNFEQLRFALRIGAGSSLLFCEICMAVCQKNHCIRRNNLRTVEKALFQIARHGVVQRRELFLRFIANGADALAQNHAPVNGGLTIAAHSLAVDKDCTVVLHGLHVLRRHLLPTVEQTFIGPIILDFFGINLFAFLAQIERVKLTGGDGVQLVRDDAGGAVRAQDAGARLEAYAANEKLIVLNIYILLFTDMAVADRLLNDPRLAFRFLKALGQILGIVYVHVNAGFQILLTQCFNSLHVFLSHKKFLLRFSSLLFFVVSLYRYTCKSHANSRKYTEKFCFHLLCTIFLAENCVYSPQNLVFPRFFYALSPTSGFLHFAGSQVNLSIFHL